MKRSRLFTLLLTATMIVPLAACGGSSNASGTVKLSFFANNSQDAYKKVIGAFEKKYPNISIDFSTTTGSQNGYQQTLQTRISGHQLADVYMVPPEALKDLVKANVAKDLTHENFMSKVGENSKKDYTVDGKVYGMSVSAWSNAYAYNKDLLKKVGYDTIPSTWDEFLTMCKKLKNAGITPYLEAKDGLGNPVEGWIGYDSSKMGTALDTKINDGKTTFEKGYTKYYAAWNKIIKEGLMSSNSAGLSSDQVLSEFTSGRLAVMPAGSWYITNYNQAKLNYGFGQIPMLKKGNTPYAPGYADPAFGINAGISGKQLDAAEKFLAFLTTPEGLKLYQAGTGLIPNVSGYKAAIDSHFKLPYDLYISTGHVYLNSAHWTKGTTAMRSETFTQLQQVALGSISPEQAAKNLDIKFKTMS